MSIVADMSLAPSGERKIGWVEKNMPLLGSIKQEFEKEKPFKDLKVALSVHMEAKTAYLCRVLAAGGAEMYATGCNPLSTQDDVAAALAARGDIEVFARRGVTEQEYEEMLCRVLEPAPNIIIDDGGDLTHLMHTKYVDLIPNVIGGCEETTTGITRLRAMERTGTLRYPMIDVNDARCKHMFDNRYGTGQSVWDGINRTTNLIVAGKCVVIAGYGWCGRGAALRAKGLGARVVVTEIDPVKALEALMDGYEVMPMDEAAELGDIFVTLTGCRDVIVAKHFEKMKDGAVMCNAGHFNVEIDVGALEAAAVEKAEQRTNIMGYRMADGRWLNLLAEGRLVNLASGDGHPAEIMDMSFAIQSLSARYLVENRGKLGAQVISVPDEIDYSVAKKLLAAKNRRIDALTPEQEKYIMG
ncbi:MAG: adenosylhomocysteinase [Oscillospiraceae bacterium]|nr:adenosylhomocysteinase [Oscillospiraceae bacterium]